MKARNVLDSIREPSVEPDFSSKVIEVVEDEGLTVVGLRPRVLLPVGGGQVEDDHAADGDGGQDGFDLGRLPELREEHPALHNPHGLGIFLTHRPDCKKNEDMSKCSQ